MESMTINVRVNADDKKNFEQFCENVGMNISTAVNMFIKSVIREQKLPFEVKSDINSEIICQKLKEAENEMNNTNKRYSISEIEESMNNIINEK